MVAALTAGCGNGDATDGDVPASGRADGLSVGPPLSLRQNLADARVRFRAAPQGLAATGRAHQLAIRGATAEVRGLPAAALRRQRIQAALRASALPAGAGDAASQRRALAAALDTARGADGPALQLETLSIARDGFECVQGAAPAALAGDGAAVRGLAGCSERWTNDERGAEVAYHFPARPSGSGDLLVSVRARLTGAAAPPIVTSDARGLRFTAAGATPFVYGHATWVDAAGRQTAVNARWTGAAIELTVPAEIIASSRYPAVLDPVVGPDLGTDRPALVPASAGLDPDVAFDGTNFLVVFSDFQRIRAVRADADGHLLDTAWLDLGEDNMFQFEPAVAFGGGHYLVTWWQDDGSALTVRSRLINPDGTVVGTGSVTVSAEQAIDDAVAWNGQSFLVSWTGFGDPAGIRVAEVDATGAVVAGSQRSLSNTGSFVGHPRIGTGTNVDLVAWEDGNATGDFTNRMFAARLGRDGTVLDAAGVRLSANDSDETQVKLASAGDSFLIAWRRAAELSTIQGTVLGDDGVLRAEDFPISRSTGQTSLPAVIFDGARYLVAWEDERDVPAIFGSLVATDGTALSAEDTKLSNVSVTSFFDQTALAWDGSRFVVVFQGERFGSDGNSVVGIEGSLVAPDLTTDGTSHSFTQLPTGQIAPSVVWDGQDYVVTWFDQRDPGFSQATFRAVRITTAGEVLDPDGIVLSGDDHGVVATMASNAAGASQLVWSTPQATSFERSLAADGTLGPIQPLSNAQLFEPPVVAGNGRGYLVVLSTQGATDFTLNLSARLLGANGTLGAPFVVQNDSDFAAASVVATGLDYLVGATRNNTGQVIPISRAGRVGRPIPLAMSSPSITAANSGRNTLVSWIGDTNNAPVARLFDNGGFRGRTLQLAPAGAGFATALAWDGRMYWAVWTGDGTTRLPFIRRISAAGVLGPPSQLLDDECEGPALASNDQRQLLLACFKFSDHFRVVRVSTRLITTP